MSYKAFQDWYHEASIRHLLLYEYNGNLMSPPFATEKCKDYSKILLWDGITASYIELDLPPVTSKTNAVVKVKDSLWLIPYGIYDNFNIVVELRGKTPIYHTLDNLGKGQFYSAASNGDAAFSFPLGYEGTEYGLYITNGKVESIKFNNRNHIKLHMGCVYANNRFWSMPRSDTEGYIDIMSFDGNTLESYPIVNINPIVTRKYTDIVVVGEKLYALPFGETSGLNEIIEFDTVTKETTLYPIYGPDFAKKYNVSVLVGNKIIGLPYGDEYCQDSNLGITFDIVTKQITQFDIGITYGGKYRYRSGIEYRGYGFFFPTGTPSCPIFKISQDANVIKKLYLENTMIGRPIIYQDKIFVMSYDILTHSQKILSFDEELNYKVELEL